MEQECHRYASRNAPSPILSTLCPSATTGVMGAPAASGDLTTLTYWWMCPSTIHLFLSRLFARIRKGRFSSSPSALIIETSSFHSRVCAFLSLPGVTFLGGAFCSLRVPFHLVGAIVAYSPSAGDHFPRPRTCGLFALPFGNGTCHSVHRGLLLNLARYGCVGFHPVSTFL